MLLVFAGGLHWFPTGGMVTAGIQSTGIEYAWDVARHMVLPVLTMVAVVYAQYLMVMRASLLEEMSADYLVTARAKGLREDDVRRKHAVPNALLPTVTLIFLTLGGLVAGSLTGALVPVLLGLTAVLATFGLVSLPSQFIPMDKTVSEVILLIGLAVGVDYALFYLRRERDERRAGRSEGAALQAAAATSGRAVLISGFTVMIAMAGMFFSGDKTFMSFAIGTMLVVFAAMIGSLTVLPAILSVLGDRVEKGRIPFVGRRRQRSESAEGSRFWGAILRPVLRHPLIAAVASATVLVLLAVPALQLHTAQSGLDAMPKSLPSSRPSTAWTTPSRAARPGPRSRSHPTIPRGSIRRSRTSRRRPSRRARCRTRSTSSAAPTARPTGWTCRLPARAPTGCRTTPWRP